MPTLLKFRRYRFVAKEDVGKPFDLAGAAWQKTVFAVLGQEVVAIRLPGAFVKRRATQMSAQPRYDIGQKGRRKGKPMTAAPLGRAQQMLLDEGESWWRRPHIELPQGQEPEAALDRLRRLGTDGRGLMVQGHRHPLIVVRHACGAPKVGGLIAWHLQQHPTLNWRACACGVKREGRGKKWRITSLLLEKLPNGKWACFLHLPGHDGPINLGKEFTSDERA